MQAKQSGADPFAAIESALPWEAFIASVTEAQKLDQPEEFDMRAGNRPVRSAAPPRTRLQPLVSHAGR